MMRFLCLLLSATGTLSQDASEEAKFREFVVTFHKSYSQEELPERKAIFLSNIKKIDGLRAENGGHAQFSHLSPFADLTHNEYINMHGYNASANGLPCQWSEAGKGPTLNPTAKAKDSLDYEKAGVMTPIKNQDVEHCASCWAFATTAVVEGRLKLDTGNLVSLSEQYIIDCDSERAIPGSGCGGGLTERALHWLAAGNPIPSEATYPYVERDQKCQTGVTPSAQLVSFGVLGSDDLASALTQYGPIAQAFDVTMIQMYKSGIITQPSCSVFTHMMVYVGYGEENGVQYWKIRNSWGTDFGEAGYFRVIRNGGSCAFPDGCPLAATGVKAASVSLV